MNKDQKWMLAIAAIVIIAFAWYGGYLTIKTPSGSTIGGQPTQAPVAGSVPLTLNLPFQIFNGTSIAYTSASPTVMLFNGAPSAANLVAAQSTATPYALTGSVYQGGSYNLLVAPSSTGTYGTIDTEASAGSGVTLGAPSIVTYQGSYWTEYPISFAGLGQLSGSQSITGNVNLFGYVAETAGTTSLLNSTAITSANLGSATTTSYFSGWAANSFGQGYKIVRMELNMSATNATDYDNGAYTLKSVTINMGNGQSITTSNIYWAGINNAYIEVGNPNGAMYLCGTSTIPQYQFSALPVLYGQADSSTGTLTINFNWQGKSANSLVYSVKLVAMSPTGTLATTYSGGSVS